jgi:hypothetical protein
MFGVAAGSIPAAYYSFAAGMKEPDWPLPWQVPTAVACVCFSIVSFAYAKTRQAHNRRDQENYDPNVSISQDKRIRRGQRRAGLLNDFEQRFGAVPRPNRDRNQPSPPFETIPLEEPFGDWLPIVTLEEQ